MNKNNKALKCINCDADIKISIFDWLFLCRRCGLYKSLLHDKKYNGEEPIGWTESANDFLEKLREDNAREILKELSKHTNLKEINLLDIGCAAGWFLNIAEQHNMVAMGLEPEKNIAEKGIEKGLNIKTKCFPDGDLSNKNFDLITFNDVFEHIEKPDEILNQVNLQIEDGGFLMINIPSSDGIFYKLSSILAKIGYFPPLERLWQKGYFSPHLYYYSHSNLKSLVEKHGFILVSKKTLDVFRINGLWSRITHNGSINIVISVVIYISMIAAYPFLKYVFPSDIMFHIYQKNSLSKY